MNNTNIIIVGVGGQGTLLASKVLSIAAQEQGLFVRTSETIGMAQRGGSVSSHVRICAQELSPAIPNGHADLLLGFELSEAARTVGKLANGACAIINAEKIVPTNVALKKGVYLEDEYMALLQKRVPNALFIQGTPLAIKAGNARSLNVVMLGAACGAKMLPFTEDEMRCALAQAVKPKTLDVNIKAFELGFESVAR